MDHLEWDLARAGTGQHLAGPRQLQLCQRAHQHRDLDLGRVCLPCGLCLQVGDRAGGGRDKARNNSSKNHGLLIARQNFLIWVLPVRWEVG